MNDSRKVLVLGDSHSLVFQHSGIFKKVFNTYEWDVLAIIGATISGIENPNSKTKALPKFIDKLSESRRDIAILQLDEVDMGFVAWFRAEKYDESIEEIKRQTLNKYIGFINIVKQHCDRVIVISSPLPTIPDEGVVGDVANQRSSIKTSQKDRTMLTLEFNREMEKYSTEHSFEYMNLDTQSLGDTGLVDRRLVNATKSDHHYDKKVYAKLLVDNLKNYLEE